MTYTSETGVARHTHYEVDQLESSVSQLSRELEDLRSESYGMSESVSAVESAVERVRDSVSDLEGELEALTDRTEWLEAVIARAGLAKPVKLDGTAADRKLGQANALRLAAETSLLSDSARASKTNVIDQVRRARRLGADARAEVAAAAARLAELDTHNHPEVEAAARTYQDAKRKMEKAAGIVNGQKDTAARYEAELAEDDRMREELAETIAVGRRASMTLTSRYRTLIGEAVASAAMFPRWMVAALGPSAPADDAAGWVATAAEIVVYRLTFGVTSATRALGERPDYQAPNYQSSAYHELWAKVRRH